MDEVDWMVLSAMQDVTNLARRYEGRPGGLDEGYAFPGMKRLLKDFAGCVKSVHYPCLISGDEKVAAQASSLLAKHGDDVIVVLEVVAELINNPSSNAKRINHFVRLLGPITWTNTQVTAQIYTWGSTRTIALDPTKFKRFVGGYVVGARKLAIDL